MANITRLIPRFLDCGESALLVIFDKIENVSLTSAISKLEEDLRTVNLPGLRESIPAVCSITIFYDALILPRALLASTVETLCSSIEDQSCSGKTWIIPVCYSASDALDLETVASLTQVTLREAVELHLSAIYSVEMIGFLPGFAYLRGLPEALYLPRRKTPRLAVPAGSVAIANDMSAVYPLESPGGWHVIGRSPVRLWDMAYWDEPLLRVGDTVRFHEIDPGEAEYLELKAAQGWRPSPVME